MCTHGFVVCRVVESLSQFKVLQVACGGHHNLALLKSEWSHTHMQLFMFESSLCTWHDSDTPGQSTSYNTIQINPKEKKNELPQVGLEPHDSQHCVLLTEMYMCIYKYHDSSAGCQTTTMYTRPLALMGSYLYKYKKASVKIINF